MDIKQIADDFEGKVREAAQALGMVLADGRVAISEADDVARIGVLAAEIVGRALELTGEEKMKLALELGGRAAKQYEVEGLLDDYLQEAAEAMVAYDVPGFPDIILDRIFTVGRVQEGLMALKKLALTWLMEKAVSWMQKRGWLNI